MIIPATIIKFPGERLQIPLHISKERCISAHKCMNVNAFQSIDLSPIQRESGFGETPTGANG